MDWLKKFHYNHAALVRMLSKLEGNLKDIKYGEAGANVVWELREFVDLAHYVVIPHFKAEEATVYPRLAAAASTELRGLVDSLYKEHNQLYEAFEGFTKAVLDIDCQEDKVGRRREIAVKMARSGNFNKIESLKNFKTFFQNISLVENIDKETLLQHGFVILQLLQEHMEKENEAKKLAAIEKSSFN